MIATKQTVQEPERLFRTHYLESPEDFNSLVRKRDVVRLKDWGRIVYYGRDNGTIRLFGVTRQKYKPYQEPKVQGAFIGINLDGLKIENGRIVSGCSQVQYTDLDEEHRQLLERTGVLQ